jgi:hypothetical protein
MKFEAYISLFFVTQSRTSELNFMLSLCIFYYQQQYLYLLFV